MSCLMYQTPDRLVDVDLHDDGDPSMVVEDGDGESLYLPLPVEAVRMLAAGAVCTILTWAVEWANVAHWVENTRCGLVVDLYDPEARTFCLVHVRGHYPVKPSDFGPFDTIDGEDARAWLQRTLDERGTA